MNTSSRIQPGDRVRLLPFDKNHPSYLPMPERFGDIVFVDGVLDKEDAISFDRDNCGWALHAVEKVSDEEWNGLVAELERDEKRLAVRSIVGSILEDLTDRRGLRQTWEGIDPEIQAAVRAAWEARVVEGLKDWQNVSLPGPEMYNFRFRRAQQLKSGRKDWDLNYVDPKWREADEDPTDRIARIDPL